jgi:hypothetical protein
MRQSEMTRRQQPGKLEETLIRVRANWPPRLRAIVILDASNLTSCGGLGQSEGAYFLSGCPNQRRAQAC